MAAWVQQRQQADHEQQLEPVLPEPEAGAFHGQVGLAGSVAQFHLPAAGIGEDHFPGVFNGSHGFVGQQVPGLASLAGSGDHQPQGLFHLGVTDWQVDDARLSVLTAMDVPHQSVVHRALPPGDLPGVAAALLIDEKVARMPAHNETQSSASQFPEPGASGEAPVPHVNHPVPLLFGTPFQQGSEVGEPLGGPGAAASPPAHGRQGGRARVASYHEGDPLQAWDEYRPTSWRIVVAGLDALQAGGFAGTNRPQPFQDALVPQGQGSLPSLLQISQGQVSTVPQVLQHQRGSPLLLLAPLPSERSG